MVNFITKHTIRKMESLSGSGKCETATLESSNIDGTNNTSMLSIVGNSKREICLYRKSDKS